MGAGGSPCRSGRISGDSPPAQDCRGYRLRPRAGRRGAMRQKGICAPELRGRRGLTGSPPPGGRAHGYGCGRQPLRSGRAGGFAVGPALAIPQGLPTAPKGGAEGGFVGGYDWRCICCLRPIEIQPFRDS